jgi:3-deoxy-D-manno-octulosonate 8-phosphate phosphatase (KDO 8-P phosphatase)
MTAPTRRKRTFMGLCDIGMLVLDVDGVLTPGHVILGVEGEVLKVFHIRDGSALKRWKEAGCMTAIVSGRAGAPLARRAEELGIDHVRQGVTDKRAVLADLLRQLSIEQPRTAYVGDDVPDIPAMHLCGFSAAVADAHADVKRAASYVTRRGGGCGAIAEVIDLLLRGRGRRPSGGGA